MGNRITKIELEQLLNARNAELEAARLQIAELQGQLLAARGTAPSVRRERPVRPVDPEVLRRRETDEHGEERHIAEEFAVLDRVGRMQLPQDFVKALELKDRVRLTLEPDHAGVWPDRKEDA